MYDVGFIRSCRRLRGALVNGWSETHSELTNATESREYKAARHAEARILLDAHRSRVPYTFSIETTNACNQVCPQCPRTKMTRPVQHMSMSLFKRIIDQCRVPDPKSMQDFARYVQAEHDIKAGEKSEDAFYFYVSSSHLTLHGYGEPLCDPQIVERVRYCSRKSVPTYLSCVPLNATDDKMRGLLDAGLGVLKFSLDAVDKNLQSSSSSEAMSNIHRAVEMRDKGGYPTKIAIIKLDSGRVSHELFHATWDGYPVMAYIKSMDNRWHAKDIDAPPNRSHYERQYCEYPWTSLTVMSNGKVVPCPQDYDCEMELGDANNFSLEEIWNGTAYQEFRKAHVTGEGDAGTGQRLKCFDRCDQKVVADWREG